MIIDDYKAQADKYAPMVSTTAVPQYGTSIP